MTDAMLGAPAGSPPAELAPQQIVETQGSESFRFIDVIRGLAASLVVVFHLNLALYYVSIDIPVARDTWDYWLVFGAVDLGRFAVSLFFMVSGFLIPSTLRSVHPSAPIFVVHRFFRIYPAYWLSLATLFLYFRFSGVPNPAPPSTWLANITMLQRFLGFADVNAVYWTLQIEVIFYALCLVQFKFNLLGSSFRLFCSMLLCAVLLALARKMTAYNLPVVLFIALSLMYLGDLLRCADRSALNRRECCVAFIIFLVMVWPICKLAYGDEAMRYAITYVIAIVTFGVLFRIRESIQRMVWAAPLTDLGANLSYGIYLFHAPVAIAVASHLFNAYHRALPAIGAAFAVTLLFAAVSYFFVEKPSIRIGRRIGNEMRLLGTTR